MTAFALHGRRVLWTLGTRAACLVLIAGVLGGCAGSAPPIQLPAELPLSANEGIFRIRWALQQEPTVARALGQIEYDVDVEHRLAVYFYGLDGAGSILSRGVTYVYSSLSYAPIPFVVELKPTGRETSFELRVQSRRDNMRDLR